MKKRFVLLSGIFAQMVLGSIYSWSEIGRSLEASFSFESWQTQLIFGLTIATFSFGTIITGKLIHRWKPSTLCLISAAGFFLAFFIASQSRGQFWILLPSIGILGGVGIAFGYVIPLATLTAWFPNHKGTVAGLAVMGFGAGAIVSSWLIKILQINNWQILDILKIIGIVGSSILFFASFFQRFPCDHSLSDSSSGSNRISLRSVRKDSAFWTLCITMFLSTLGGLIVIGSVSKMAVEFSIKELATIGVSVLAIGNAFGRLLWGAIIDKLGKKAIYFSNVIMSFGFVLLFFGMHSSFLFLLGVFFVGLQFGSSLVLYAAFTEIHFGDGAISRIYPAIFAAYGIAALVGPALGGLLFDILGSYQMLLIALIAVPILALLVFVKQFHSCEKSLHL